MRRASEAGPLTAGEPAVDDYAPTLKLSEPSNTRSTKATIGGSSSDPIAKNTDTRGPSNCPSTVNGGEHGACRAGAAMA